MPVAMISTSTSPAFGPSRSSSTISSGCLGAKATAARVFIVSISRFYRSGGLGHLVAVALGEHEEQDQRNHRAHRHDDRDGQQLVIAEPREQGPRDDRAARRAEPANAEHEAGPGGPRIGGE